MKKKGLKKAGASGVRAGLELLPRLGSVRFPFLVCLGFLCSLWVVLAILLWA